MGLVVRCPECRGKVGVDDAAQGHTVQCPRCDSTFVAVPEAALVSTGRPKRNPTLPTRPQPPAKLESPQLPPLDETSLSTEADHDPHRHPPGGLPASVLIGLALLPFAIPVLWLIAPAVIGQPPMLSIAVPLSIAVSASILSLAVIYTIDWSPAVRVKGVLMLLGLAYFVSISLFFLKKEMVEWVKKTFDRTEWVTFFAPNPQDGYTVMLPRFPKKDMNYQPIPGSQLECHTLSHSDAMGEFAFVIGAGSPPKGDKDSKPGTDSWFEHTMDSIIAESQGQLDPNQQTQKVKAPPAHDCCGREFGIKLGDDKTIRVVRVFVINGRVYYLSIEGNGLNGNDDIARKFFDSFYVGREMK